MKHLALLFAIVLTSCVSIPDTPPGEKCMVWAPLDQSVPKCLCVDAQSGEETRRIPIYECHKFIAVSFEYAEKIDEYHQRLIDLARRRCRQ